jgi:tRNA threonylcarbamoyl adenosine modification protein (Sua5/YciO/YrdC/YwlC family)
VSDPLEEAAEAAGAGGLIVFPTDTVYGLGTRPDDPDATARLFEAKGRPRDLELPVLVASVADAERIARFDARARALAGWFWPGPLTLVLPRTLVSETWDLGEDRATIAVRMPHHPLALALLARAGPLATSSANRTGAPTPATADELERIFGGAVDVYLCQDAPLEGRPSTVLDLTGADLRVLREGVLGEEQIREVLVHEVPSVRR